jgi:signal peptidase
MSVDIRKRLPNARSVAATLAVMILVAAIVPFLVFAVPQVVGADHSFVILSGSMEPTTSPGDVVIVDASAAIAIGDVITFDDGNTAPTTHRIVDIEDGKYVTKGDANQNPDAQRVAPSDVLGRVTLTIPFIGHVILWVNTPIGYASLVIAPLVLLVGSELFVWAREKSNSGDSDGEEASDDGNPVPKPAVRHIDDVRAESDDATSESSDDNTPTESEAVRETVTVARTDLKLTALAMVGMVAYAAWNVYREVATVAAPNPVSVAALTGGLLGLGFAVWVTVTTWLTAADCKTDRLAPTPPSCTDGGTEDEQ